MTLIVSSQAPLSRVAPPALPVATNQYERAYQDQLNNILRLYFNRISGTLNQLETTDPTDGYTLRYPYAAIQRTTDRTFVANTPTQVTFNVNDFLNEMANDGTDGIEVTRPGIYNYQFSAQFANTDTQIHAAYIWLRINGVDVPGTNSKWDVTAKHGTSDGYLLAAANFYVQLDAGDTVEMYAAVSNAGVYMEAYAAQTTPFPMPSIPSVVATLTFVSALP